MVMNRSTLYTAIADAGPLGISVQALAQRFEAEPQTVHNYIGRLVREQPARVVRPAKSLVVAACYHPASAGQVHATPTRRLGIVVGSQDHQILLALRAPGGMTSEQISNRFTHSPSSALSRLRAAGLIASTGEKEKQTTLTEKGRALVDPDGPLARRRTLNTYCQL
jgi:hypothetical protein